MTLHSTAVSTLKSGVCGIKTGCEGKLIRGFRSRFFKFFYDFEDAVPSNDGIVHDEPQCGSIFQNHGTSDQALNAFAMTGEESKTALLLVRVAQNADENDGRVKIACYVNVVDRDEAGFADLEFPANSFADLAFQ